MNKVLGYIQCGKDDGASLIYGGNQVLQETGGYYLQPAIVDKVSPEHRIAQNEIFGPVLSVIGFKDESEAVEIANHTDFGLAASVATQTLGRAQRMSDALSAGIISVMGTGTATGGGVSISVEGHRQSGFGLEGGVAGLAAYTATSSVYFFS